MTTNPPKTDVEEAVAQPDFAELMMSDQAGLNKAHTFVRDVRVGSFHITLLRIIVAYNKYSRATSGMPSPRNISLSSKLCGNSMLLGTESPVTSWRNQ